MHETDTMNLTSLTRPFAQIACAMQRLLRWFQRMALGLTRDNITTVAKAGTAGNDRASGAEQRCHPRVPLQDVVVHVTDGCLFATAVMENISPGGLCLSNLPEQLYNHGGTLTVYSSNNPGLPVLQVQPRWQKNGWNGKSIGAAILNATDAWRLFFVHTASQYTA